MPSRSLFIGDRRTVAMELRSRLGLITHTSWRSLFPYSTQPDAGQVRIDRIVNHYHGGSAQLPRYTSSTFEAQMRHVDGFHRNDRGWTRGFAYAMGIDCHGGRIAEARSTWVNWGAHRGDHDGDGIPENVEGFPIYWAQGQADGYPTQAAIDAHGRITEALTAITGHRFPQIGHGEVDPINHRTPCPGPVLDYIRTFRSNPTPTPGDDAMIEKIFKHWSAAQVRQFKKRGWFWGDAEYYVRMLPKAKGGQDAPLVISDVTNMVCEVLAKKAAEEASAGSGSGDVVFDRPVTISPI